MAPLDVGLHVVESRNPAQFLLGLPAQSSEGLKIEPFDLHLDGRLEAEQRGEGNVRFHAGDLSKDRPKTLDDALFLGFQIAAAGQPHGNFSGMFSLLGRSHRCLLRADGGGNLFYPLPAQDDLFERTYGGVRALQRRADGHSHIHVEFALVDLRNQLTSQPGDQSEPAQREKEHRGADHDGFVSERPADQAGIDAGDRAEAEVKEAQQGKKQGEQHHADETEGRNHQKHYRNRRTQNHLAQKL